jgi:hypothetical protein
MPQTGIAWDFRMQYLAGGVNTGSGWETWNANGTFALNYANESAQHGYIPMFPYYELLQSSGTCGSCGEGQKDITNLNTPSLMQSYYGNFALLMQRLGPGTFGGVAGFGKTALVNVEPDFSGGYAFQAVNLGNCFGFCTGKGNDPNFLNASVASSGYAGVAAYPNTYVGFTQALAHLRDLYAPNVILGYDLSPWATGDDIGLDTSTSTNGAALGQQLGVFEGKVGPHELLFTDPSDRDAGQYKYVYGQSSRFWDRLNVAFPNFTRWEQYLHAALAADGGKPLYLWQVPLGNQYFDNENNTNDHYQDNRAEYIFGHVSELIQTGIAGAIFMAGNAGNTTYNDQDNDGVTNAAPICTTDGVSSGQVCNNHTVTVSDDDGGFVRMSAQNYYKSPLPLSGGPPPTNTPTPTPTVAASVTATPTQTSSTYMTSANASPTSVSPGSNVSVTTSVTSSGASTVLVDVEVYSPAGSKAFQQFWDNQTFAAGQTRTYTSTWQVPASAATGTYATGTYSVDVGIFSPGWGKLYSWNGTAGSVSVTAGASPTNTATAAPTNTATTAPTNTPTPPATNTPTPRPTSTPTPPSTNTPTAPTNTPTPLPTNPPTATPTTAPAQRSYTSYTTTASVASSSVVRGANEGITLSVKSATASSVLVDLEIYDSTGAKVFQQWWDNQSFAAGQTRSYSTSWSVPASATPGTDTVKIGIFAPGWSAFYAWNNGAATFTVR